jgi:hypothetical protein
MVEQAVATPWVASSFVIVACGLVLMFAIFQRYDRPRRDAGPASDEKPDLTRPALSGALAQNGSVRLQQAMATLFALADRGIVTIVENPRRLGVPNFTVERHETRVPLHGEEAALLAVVFRGTDPVEHSVSLRRARGRVTRGLRPFKKALQNELRAQGLVDLDRGRIRTAYQVISLGSIVVGFLLSMAAIPMSAGRVGYPFLIPAAFGVIAAAGGIFCLATTPLSNEGVRRGDAGRRYKRFLKEVASGRSHLSGTSASELVPTAVALELAGTWAKYMKRQHAALPSWYRPTAAAAADVNAGFAALVIAGGAPREHAH